MLGNVLLCTCISTAAKETAKKCFGGGEHATWAKDNVEHSSLAGVQVALDATLAEAEEGHAAGAEELEDAVVEDLVALAQVERPLELAVAVVDEHRALRQQVNQSTNQSINQSINQSMEYANQRVVSSFRHTNDLYGYDFYTVQP